MADHEYTGGAYWHTTVLDNKTIRWCSNTSSDAVVQAIIDPESDQPARRVLNDGTTKDLDDQRGLTVYGRYAYDRPTAQRVAELTPEYAYLMTGLAEGRGTTVTDEHYPTPLTLQQAADHLGISYPTARQYNSSGKLGEPDVMVGSSPRWYASTLDLQRLSWRGRGARTDIPRTYASGHALQILVDEGYDEADAVAALRSLVAGGLQLDQPDEVLWLSEDELNRLRRQLFDQVGLVAIYSQEGRITVESSNGQHISDLGFYDADGGTWKDEVRGILSAAGWEPTGAWNDSTEEGDSVIIVLRRS